MTFHKYERLVLFIGTSNTTSHHYLYGSQTVLADDCRRKIESYRPTGELFRWPEVERMFKVSLLVAMSVSANGSSLSPIDINFS